MYKDSSCRSSPPPQPQPAEAAAPAPAAAAAAAAAATAVAAPAQAAPTADTPPSSTATSVAAIVAAAAITTTSTTPTSPLPVATSTATHTAQPAAALSACIEDDVFSSCPSESSSDESEYAATTQSRPSTASTTSSSSAAAAAAVVTAASVAAAAAAPVGALTHSRRSRCELNSDVRLLRKIGYIASRVRFLAKLYNDFRLVNPYSPAKQRRQLQEILLKHSIYDPARITQAVTATSNTSTNVTATATPHSLTPASSVASSYCCLPTESSYEEETVWTAGTVRRKSSATAPAPATASGAGSASASILLLEDLLVQFYEDRRNKLTVIRRRRSRRCSTGGSAAQPATGFSGSRKHLIIMSGQTSSSSVERLLQLGNENDNVDLESSSGGGGGGGGERGGGGSVDLVAKANNIFNANTASSQSQQQQPQQKRSNSLLQPSDGNLRQRRASDCSTHTGQPLSNQLQVTLKNNNCAKFPFHRGSCGAAGEHLLAANSIANRSTIILSKSCSNVDGGNGGNSGNGAASAALYGSSDLRQLAAGVAAGATTAGAGGSSVGGNSGTPTGSGVATNNTTTGTNGNGNEYSIVQLNNTIIQCHFNDDDFRALVRELKRKVEYTERMNWLCLSKRPMGPPHRKSSLPKHQDVKKRFLEICDSTFSDEVKAALRLPAFDSYEWSDADVIHLMQTMFTELGFIEKFNIPSETLREWLYEVYKHYNEVPFHNFRHCFCVAQMMYAITQRANLLERIGDLECLILLVSCICHDLDHPGYNNIYQINARTELALRYNDISPLENHHCSIAFRLLEHPECNIFKNFSRETFNQIREGIIRCILATDMARHNEILTQFKDIRSEFDYTNRSHLNLLCMVLIKVADISNEARPMDVAEPWLDRLLQEFFAQSAAEKSEGLPVTPFMDPDKVSKPGSQVRFIGLVLLPLFEALGELLPDLLDMIIIPVRVALDYYKRLNDAQSRSRKSVVDNSAAGDNSGTSDAAAAAASAGSGTGATTAAGAGGAAGNTSPQMPRSQSGMSVKSRRSIPSQKSASRTSVDEPQCMAAELQDLPEGSESGDSETATEVDVAEKTSKFKVDTEGSSNRSKSSHSTSRKSSREKRPSMIGEIASSGQRIRNSYGNIHGYSNRNHFGSNRAVSLDQYSTNNRRLSDGLQQVISDSNVFYNRQNRGSLETSAAGCRLIEDMNMNATGFVVAPGVAAGLDARTAQPPATMQVQPHPVPNLESGAAHVGAQPGVLSAAASIAHTAALSQQQHSSASNGNLSPTQQQPLQAQKQAFYAVSAVANNTSNGLTREAGASTAAVAAKSSWKARFKQFSDYFNLSFDKSGKRFGSTRSSPSSVRNNNAGGGQLAGGNLVDPLTGKPGICCTISNNLQSPGLRHKHVPAHQELINAGRNRAYSLDVPCSRSNPRYSSSSCGGGDSSRKSSRHDGGAGTGDDNNSNNTLHSSGGAGSEMPTCLPPPIRIGSVDASDTILITTGGLPRVITPANLGEAEPSLSIDLGMASGSSSDPPKI